MNIIISYNSALHKLILAAVFFHSKYAVQSFPLVTHE